MHLQEGFNPIIEPSVYQPSSADRVCEVVLRNTGLQLCDLSMCTLYVFWDKFKVEQIKLPRHFMKVCTYHSRKKSTFDTSWIWISYLNFALLQLNDYETDPYFLQLSKPKHDKWFSVYFCGFPRSYLFCTKNCFILMFRTIFCANQVRKGKKTKVNKQLLGLNWRKYGAVSYSFSCTHKFCAL